MLEKYFSAVQFIKDKVSSNLVAASTQGKLNLDETELKRVIEIVNSTIEQAAIDSSSTFEN
tara:strand:- start:108 stop:290 length:183 start_codon:yes stop_codon:yes gene_type:complete